MSAETHLRNEDIQRMEQRYDREVTVPCLVLCLILIMVLGVLPVLPSGLSSFLRPSFIFTAMFTVYRSYPLASSRWQIALIVYYAVIFICNQITGSAVSAFISHELFILFFVLAAERRWSCREINLILEATILASDIQALVLLFSNSFLLHAGGQQRINYLGTTINRNPAAFAIVLGVIASALKLIYQDKGWRVMLPRIYWTFSFLVCAYDVFAIGCRSAFYAMCLGLSCLIWDRVRYTRTAAEKFVQEILLVILAAAGLLILMRVASGAYSERLFSLEDSGRDGIWEKGMEMIRKKPVFGGGFDYWSNEGLRIGTHNSFITYALEGGILILIPVAGYFFSLGIELFRTGSVIPMAFLAETILHMISESGMDYYAYLPLILGVIILRYMQHQGSIQRLFNG